MHETRIATRWTDFDALSHVTHAAYPVYFDEARDDFLSRSVGTFAEWPSVIAHVSIDYRQEIRYPAAEVVVRTSISEIGRTSVSFEQEVVGPDGELAAVARSVVVAWDIETRGPRVIGDGERALLSAQPS